VSTVPFRARLPWRAVLCAVAAAAVTAMSGCQKKPTAPAADAVFYGGDILTMAGDQAQYVEALAVREGKIVMTGTKDEVLKLAGEPTQKIDLQGKTLMPGFIDAHGHMADYTLRWDAPDLSAPPVGNVKSIADIQGKLKRYLDAHPELAQSTQKLLVAQGYDDGLLAEKRHPTRDDLDQVSKTVPIMVVHCSGHLVVANSAALALVKFTKATKDPAGGVIRRDAKGEPNGIVEEMAAYAFLPFVPPQNREKQLATLDEIQRWYASMGITTAQDGLSNPDNISLLREAAQKDRLIIDVVSYPMWKLYAKVISGEKKLEGVEIYPPGSQVSNSGRALASNQPTPTAPELGASAPATIKVGIYEKGHKIGGVKITADGSPQGKTAFMTQPYLHPPEGQKADYKAYPAVEQAELDQWLDAAYKNNVQLLVHTNGDAAIDSLILAVERARAKHGAKDLRPVAIHAQLARKDQVEKMGQLGISPSFFSAHTYFWGDWHINETFGKERAFGISPMAFANSKGVKFTNHNDSPVVPPDMMMLAWTAVNRLSRSGVVVGPDERVSPYVAFKAMTDWAAYQYFEESSKGTLEAGKLADMVVLDSNPLKIDPVEQLKGVKVLETFKAGKSIYRLDPQRPPGPPAN
jgi:predicted amidohydrolase YtcJ